MKTRLFHAQAAVLFGLSLAFVSGVAHAESNKALNHAALRKVCTEQDGRFEQAWLYNDQGMQWGDVVSCVTNTGYIRCQGNFCRSGRWMRRDAVAASSTGARKNDVVEQFVAEPAAFSAALTALSRN